MATHTGEPSGSRLDRYVDQYAMRTAGMTASEIRALFSVASRPEVVSLAGGMPYVSALPLDAVGAAIGDLIAKKGSAALQYGGGQGDPALRAHICEVMALEGIHAHADDVVVTTGSQQALDLVTRIFVDPGDVVLAESPSYVGALQAFRSYQAEVVHVPMDADGLVPSALHEALAACAAQGRRVKFLYTIPNFHNPAGVSLSAGRRPQVLEICRSAGVLVLEDNPYGLLGFEGEPYRALRADGDDGVLYLGSFSKTFAPGLRVGWVVAPRGVREKLVLAAEATMLCPSALSQAVVCTYLENFAWKEQIKAFRVLYQERRDAVLETLTSTMPPCSTWTHPAGGFYVWLTLPDGLDTAAMMPRAITAKVAYVPGTAFYAGDLDAEARASLRLSYCYPPPDRIREGVRRLAAVVEQELDLRRSLGLESPPADAPRTPRRGNAGPTTVNVP
jgi:2-aminoadipate transaminase